MISNPEHNRIRWASRRGMLELDLCLVPFFDNCFSELDEVDQQRYITLLEGEDTDLFYWMLGRGRPTDPDLIIIVDKILHYLKHRPLAV
ncbi:MAG: antitoxin CptB [Paraglaciecola psychrophila]|jgi:antitoxin CptB